MLQALLRISQARSSPHTSAAGLLASSEPTAQRLIHRAAGGVAGLDFEFRDAACYRVTQYYWDSTTGRKFLSCRNAIVHGRSGGAQVHLTSRCTSCSGHTNTGPWSRRSAITAGDASFCHPYIIGSADMMRASNISILQALRVAPAKLLAALASQSVMTTSAIVQIR